ncbi:MAG: hypothetical protein H0U79_06395 [Solirubrobacterales bacterium]|nr:hypothetical protein [Solirubrobacterales bacterium]
MVKPAVSAGSLDTARHTDPARAREHVAALLATGRTVMVQPYLPAVDTWGETALLYLDGRFSHAIRKGPLLSDGAATEGGLYLEEEIEPRVPSVRERQLGDAVIALATERLGRLLYARVDVLADPSGAPVLLELELAEPSLLLAHGLGASARLAAGMAAEIC